jgi:hypothetical protein
LSLQPVQRRVKRTGIDLQQLTGAVPDCHADSIAVLRTPLQRLQNQKVQRSLQKFNSVLVPTSLFTHFLSCVLPSKLRPPTALPHCSLGPLFAIDDRTPPFVPSRRSTFYPLAVDTLHPTACNFCAAPNRRQTLATQRLTHLAIPVPRPRLLASAIAIPISDIRPTLRRGAKPSPIAVSWKFRNTRGFFFSRLRRGN